MTLQLAEPVPKASGSSKWQQIFSTALWAAWSMSGGRNRWSFAPAGGELKHGKAIVIVIAMVSLRCRWYLYLDSLWYRHIYVYIVVYTSMVWSISRARGGSVGFYPSDHIGLRNPSQHVISLLRRQVCKGHAYPCATKSMKYKLLFRRNLGPPTDQRPCSCIYFVSSSCDSTHAELLLRVFSLLATFHLSRAENRKFFRMHRVRTRGFFCRQTWFGLVWNHLDGSKQRNCLRCQLVMFPTAVSLYSISGAIYLTPTCHSIKRPGHGKVRFAKKTRHGLLFWHLLSTSHVSCWVPTLDRTVTPAMKDRIRSIIRIKEHLKHSHQGNESETVKRRPVDPDMRRGPPHRTAAIPAVVACWWPAPRERWNHWAGPRTELPDLELFPWPELWGRLRGASYLWP